MQTAVAPDMNPIAVPPELSRVVRLDDIAATAHTITIDATVRECMAIAARFELSYLRNLSAEVTYRRIRSGTMIRIDGRITATYGQLCGVTLSPMPMVMEESFQTEYTLTPWERYSEFDLDQPEILTDDFIDVGEVVAEYFGLGIDPYVRRAGAERLPELSRYLSEAVQELLASNTVVVEETVEEPVSAPMTAAEPELADMVFVDQPVEVETEEPTAEIIEIHAVPEALESDVPAPENESLFMKYLRKLRAA